MATFITNEEWAALLGIESVLVQEGAQTRQSKGRYHAGIRMQIRTTPMPLDPVLSIRDIISSEEIAALLALFAIGAGKSTSNMARETKPQRRSPIKKFRGR
jgi:hypothetical protein